MNYLLQIVYAARNNDFKLLNLSTVLSVEVFMATARAKGHMYTHQAQCPGNVTWTCLCYSLLCPCHLCDTTIYKKKLQQVVKK